MKKMSICIILIFATIVLASCAINGSSSPLSVTKVEGENTVNVDGGSTEKILSLWGEGEWINDAPNCGYDYVFDYNGDIYRYHAECGTFYSLTDKESLALGETNRNEVNDILRALFN